MAFRGVVIIALLSITVMGAAAQSQKNMDFGSFLAQQNDQSLVSDALGMDAEMMFDTESSRRQLGGHGYISYEAMNRNRVPCGQRGSSYYNCHGHEQANPYTRGCTRGTRCARQFR